jgi:hypothetical protein
MGDLVDDDFEDYSEDEDDEPWFDDEIDDDDWLYGEPKEEPDCHDCWDRGCHRCQPGRVRLWLSAVRAKWWMFRRRIKSRRHGQEWEGPPF